MAEKRVSVRLAAVGGKQVKAEFEGIGNAGQRGIRKVSREAEIANARLARFARRAKIAAGIMAAAAVAAGIAMVRSSLQTIDEQAKLAASLRTTTANMQVLARAADLAGVSQGEVEQATIMMTKSLSQAAQGTGPAVKALDALNLSAAELAQLPIDEKMAAIQDAIARFIPTAQQAAVASQIFGSRAGLIFTRIDSATLRQATQDVADFGVVVLEADAAQIERTNDALSRMGLLWRGIANQLAVAAAPALEAVANALASIGNVTGPLGRAIKGLFNHLGEIVSIAATFAAVLGSRLVLSLAKAALGIKGVSLSLTVLRGALIRTGIGALIIGAGELVYQFGQLAKGAGGFGEAMRLLKNIAIEVWERIKLGGKSLGAALASVWARVKAGWLTMLANIQKTWADFLHAMTRGISNIPGMDSAMLAIGNAAIMAGSAYYEMAATAEEARAAADGLVTSSRDLAGAAMAPLTSMQALRNAMRAAGTDAADGIAGATAAAGDFNAALGEAGTGGPTAVLDNTAAAAGRAGGALQSAADVARQSWKAAQAAIKRTQEIAKGLADDITGPIKEALKSGELSWQTFASAISGIAQNLANRLIDQAFKPIEDALFRALSGAGSGGGGLFSWLTSALGGLFGIGGAFARGGAFGPAGEITAFAAGGVVSRPTLFPFANGIGLMGEADPEAILPLRRGRGGRLGVEAGGSGHDRRRAPEPAAQPVTRIVNVLDPSIVGDYLATPAGERLIVNVIRRNRGGLDA